MSATVGQESYLLVPWPVGILFSMSGYTRDVPQQAADLRSIAEILVFSEYEISLLYRNPESARKAMPEPLVVVASPRCWPRNSSFPAELLERRR